MPRIVDKQKKAAAIARAALGVFREAGFHRARMADIAIAADIGKGTLYEYFGDKADILRFLFDQYFEAFKEGALRALQQAGSPGARLLALVEFALDHVTEWEDHCAVYVDYFGAARVGDAKLFSLGEIYEERYPAMRIPPLRRNSCCRSMTAWCSTASWPGAGWDGKRCGMPHSGFLYGG
jgi:AcrR family transcriptional regulator